MKQHRTIIISLLLAVLLLMAGPCPAEEAIMGSDPYPDVLSSKAFPELRVIDGIGDEGVTISDIYYTISATVQYFDDQGEVAELAYFQVGDMVYFSLDGRGEINGMWKPQTE